MKQAFLVAALFLGAATALAQINVNDHVLNICAEEDKRTGFISPPFPPVGIPTTGGDMTGTLVGVTPLNPEGDLFTEVGVDRNIPVAGGGPPQPQANVDLALSGTGFNPPTVKAGETALYVAEVSNNGPDGATGVKLAITLPPELTVKSAEPTQGTCTTSGNRVNCELAALALKAQARVNLQLGVSSSARGALTATANVTGDQQDPNPANNQSTANLTAEEPPTGADLVVTKRDSADPVRVGQVIRYTLSVVNLGPLEATNVVFTDTLPPGTEFVTCSPNCEPGDVIVRCSVTRIAPGGTGVAFVDVRPTQAGTITNRVTVGGEQQDPNSANNSTSETTTVNP